MPVAGIIVAALTFLVSSNASMPSSNRIILGLVSIIIICYTFMNFYLIKNISNNYVLQKENLVANKEKEIYRLEIANSERYIREVSTIKHNIKNQLLCIETLIDEQNYTEAKEVCNNINDNIKITAHMYKTGNVYLDAILNTVYAKAKENRIKLTVNCNTNLEFVGCDDLLILVGNLVDNAIEALCCEQIKELKIDILRKGVYAILNIQNYSSKSVLKTNPNLFTSKIDVKNHGYGLCSVKRIVKKYDGDITFYEENNYFYVNIMMEIQNIT
ncbi:MAG: GHKL domain-containing protein [Erysipelotrichaceae bacterium]|nr:GHKL domain-containing protein [Erysipelotrichaceae bacterium]